MAKIGLPPGYTLFQRNDYNASLVWEERAGLTVPGRRIYDGVQNYNGKIFAIGGYDNFAKNTVEKYDPIENTWTALMDRLSEKSNWPIYWVIGGSIICFTRTIGGKNLDLLPGSTLSSVE